MNPPSPFHGDDDRARILEYHLRTKHAFERYADGPNGLDWDLQPEPFRWFDGAPSVDLPLVADGIGRTWRELGSPGEPAPLDREGIAALFELALGLAAWKRYGGDRWALRCNPSSGNLHPTEGYLVCGELPGLAAGIYHYLSREHRLERRHDLPAPFLPAGVALVGFSSIHWREAWKYGERAFRYCQLDLGHAMAAVGYSAAVLGWHALALPNFSDAAIAKLLGLGDEESFAGAEREVPDLMLAVGPGVSGETEVELPQWLEPLKEWQGRANRLTVGPREEWRLVEAAAAATPRPASGRDAAVWPRLPPSLPSGCETPAATLIRRRRSAQAFDGRTTITAEAFYRILDALLPRREQLPWRVALHPPEVHPVFFVHRVEGLPRGLYALLRDPAAMERIRPELRDSFAWERPDGCPEQLPLFRLVQANAMRAAATLSCQQSIAGDSAFAVAVVGELERALERGAYGYRELLWEAGMIGHTLYLEAEAAGVQGTGIGCFYDDPVHETLGIEGERLQVLYHFTVGGALHDARLETLPPYDHLGAR
ncbi:SagB/ThcOx family dehydrogenase [Endothiovibrio diazotrophicus]